VHLAIFDLDGTLADTVPDIAWALGATLAEVGVPAPPLATVRELVGDGSRVLIERALQRAGVATDGARDPDRLLDRFIAHYGDHLCVGSAFYPGVEEGLAATRRAGFAMAVITNKPGGLARGLLDALGVAASFAAVVGDGDGYPRKPDPAAARAVAQSLGAAPGELTVLGDGLPDMRLAKALGARAIAAAWGYTSADKLRAEGADVVAAAPADAFRALGV
jgi:phosphoglycolate phosphatase